MIAFSEPIHVVGIGASGSRIVELLAKRGNDHIRELHVWDGDVVDLSNTRSQTYWPEHIGLLKVDALARQARTWGGIELVRHPERVDGPRPFSGIVCSCVDKMSARWTLWESSIRRNREVSLMIEMRLDTANSLIHVVDPNDEEHIRQWERYWYPDDEATTAGLSCGAATSLGPIASVTASLCVWQIVRAIRIRGGSEDRLDNQIRVSMIPLEIEKYRW